MDRSRYFFAMLLYPMFFAFLVPGQMEDPDVVTVVDDEVTLVDKCYVKV